MSSIKGMRLFSTHARSMEKYIQYKESRQLCELERANCGGAKGDTLMGTKTI